jgi:TonB-dependent receptor
MITSRVAPWALTGLLLCSVLPTSVHAQSGRISGVVTDVQTGERLPGANVVIMGTSRGAATDVEGRYAIAPVPAGSHTIAVSYIGYLSQRQEITIGAGESLTLDFRLSWEGVTGDEIVITAQAAGQVAAINQQLASNTITNIVSRDRIQELPDVNAAESIGRLPGISIQRSGGEANKVVIRGLSPKYNTVTVNGVRVPSTGGDDRSIDLSLISSNMLDGIEVRKAVTPDMDADALGGAVDLRLREAPDRLMVDFLAQGGHAALRDSYGNYKFAGSVGNRFLDNRLGVIANFNVDSYDRSSDIFSGDYRFSPTNNSTVVTATRLREETVERGRTGGSLVFDYRIPRGKITANTFYNRLSSDALIRINDMNANENRHYLDMESRVNDTSILTGALAAEQDFGLFRYDVGISFSTSNAKNPEDLLWRFGKEGDVFTAQPSVETHPNQIPAMVRPDSSMGLHNLWMRSVEREENVTTAQLNLQAPFRLGSWITGHVRTGAKLRWLDRFNDEEQVGRAGLQYPGGTTGPLACVASNVGWDLPDGVRAGNDRLPLNFVLDTHQRTDFLGGEYNLGMTYQESMMRALSRALQQCEDHNRKNSIGSMGRDYDGVERFRAGYIMAEMNLGRYVTVLPGIRWESDYSRYNGQRYREVITSWEDREPADLEYLTNERDNSFWLPALHVQIRPADWLTVRLARTETLTRPDYIQYAPITTINTYTNYIRAANALLRPAHATNYDAAVSVYQRYVGLLTASAFTKSIADLVISLNYRVHPDVPVLPGMNLPQAWIDADPVYGADTYMNNPFEATYRGFELDWQTNFWYAPSIMRGVVLSANYTYLQSEMDYQRFFLVQSDSIKTIRPRTYYMTMKDDSLRTGRMPDQPTHVANVTLGYDFRGFSARVSYLYQSDVSTSISLRQSDLLDTFSGAYARWDLSLSQRLRQGFEVFGNFNNLAGRPDRSFRESAAADHRPSYTEYYGFTMDVGARYRF